MKTITLTRVESGLYQCKEVPSIFVVKDGYSSPREAEAAFKQELSRGIKLPGGEYGPSSDYGDKRLKGYRFDGIEYEPEEVCWCVVYGDPREGDAQNIDITDRLKDAKDVIRQELREVEERAVKAVVRFVQAHA